MTEMDEELADLVVTHLNTSLIGADESDKDFDNKKRDGYLSWDEYFMAVAFLSAQRSKDPNTQVGACIVNDENKIVGIGYNGMPNGCDDDAMPWRRKSKNGDILETKRLFVCHAEMNAIVNKFSAEVKNSRIYVTLFPCNECAKLIIQSRISEVIYCWDTYHDKVEFKASRMLMDKAGVTYRQFIPPRREVVIDFCAACPPNNCDAPVTVNKDPKRVYRARASTPATPAIAGVEKTGAPCTRSMKRKKEILSR